MIEINNGAACRFYLTGKTPIDSHDGRLCAHC